MQCCPLSGGDDGPEIDWTKIMTARKPHVCCECEEPILPGQKYEICTGRWDGAWNSYKTCMSCREIRNHFACSSGWTFTTVWDDIQSNFFPGMVAGGPCMKGLSPEAKARLFERRLAWIEADPEYAQDEIQRHRRRREQHEANRFDRWTWAWREIGLEVAVRAKHGAPA